MDEVYATHEVPSQNYHVFIPIQFDGIFSAHLHGRVCSEICLHLNEGEALAFEVDDDVIIVRTTRAGPQTVIPDNLKQIVIYAHHYSKLAAYS